MAFFLDGNNQSRKVCTYYVLDLHLCCLLRQINGFLSMCFYIVVVFGWLVCSFCFYSKELQLYAGYAG